MRHLVVGLGLGCLFLGWNAPNHYPPWTTFHLELFAGLGLCLLFVAVLMGSHRAQPSGTTSTQCGETQRLAPPRAALAWLAMALLPVLQYLSGSLAFRGDALLGLLYGTGVSLSLYVGMLWAVQRGRAEVVRAICLTLVLGAIAASGLGLIQWLRLGAPSWWAMELIDDRPFANFAQPNHLGLLMVMAIVATTALYETRVVEHRWVWGLSVSFFGWGILVSQSRSAALALIAVTLVWQVTRRWTPTRLRWPDIALGVVVALLMSASLEPLQRILLLQNTELRVSVESGGRLLIWRHFWAANLERPWFGYGFNQGVMALAEVATQVEASRNVVFAHCFVLDLMTWFGIPVAVLATAAAALWMLAWLRPDSSSEFSAQRHWTFAIWLALVIQSLLEFPYAHSYFLLPAALLAGAITLPGNAATPLPSGKPVSASRWMVALAAGASLLFGLLCWEYFGLEEDFRFNRFARANFTQLGSNAPQGRPLILDQLGALNASASIVAKPDMPESEIKLLQSLARRFHMISVRLEYAKALSLNGRPAEAERELLVMRSALAPAQYEKILRHWHGWKESQAAAERL